MPRPGDGSGGGDLQSLAKRGSVTAIGDILPSPTAQPAQRGSITSIGSHLPSPPAINSHGLGDRTISSRSVDFDPFAGLPAARPKTAGLGSEPVMPAIGGSVAPATPATPQMTWDHMGDVGGTPQVAATAQRASVSSIAGDGAGAGADDRTDAAPGSAVSTDGDAGGSNDVIEPPARKCICGKPADLGCTRCRGAFYCSAECQRKDWKNHKVECKKAGAKRRSMGAMRALQTVQSEVPAFVPSQHRRESSETAATAAAAAVPNANSNAGSTPANAAMRPRPQMMSPGRRVPQPQFGGGTPQGSPGRPRAGPGAGMQRPGGGPAGFNPRGAPGIPGQNHRGGPGGMMSSPLRVPSRGPPGAFPRQGAGFPGMNPPQVVQGVPRTPNRGSPPTAAVAAPPPPAAVPPQMQAPDGETDV